MRWKLKSKQEIIKELEQATEDYNKEFSDVLIPKEKFGMACALKYVLEIDKVEKWKNCQKMGWNSMPVT